MGKKGLKILYIILRKIQFHKDENNKTLPIPPTFPTPGKIFNNKWWAGRSGAYSREYKRGVQHSKINKQKSVRKCMTSKLKPVSECPLNMTGLKRSWTSCISSFADEIGTISASVLSLVGREEGDAAASQEGVIDIPAVIKKLLNSSYYHWALSNQ